MKYIQVILFALNPIFGIDFAHSDEKKNGEWVTVTILPANDAWKAGKTGGVSSDSHLIYTMESRTGYIRVCGNVSGYCSTVAPAQK